MYELIIKAVESLFDVYHNRRVNEKEFFEKFIKESYDTMNLIHEDYLSMMLLIEKSMLGDNFDRQNLINEIRLKRRELAHKRVEIYNTSSEFRELANSNRKHLDKIELTDYVDSISNYFYCLVGYPNAAIVTGKEGETISVTLLNLLRAIEFESWSNDECIKFFEGVNEEFMSSWNDVSKCYEKLKIKYA